MRMKAPITNLQAPEKLQAPSLKMGSACSAVCVLVIGISLELGAWDLELSAEG